MKFGTQDRYNMPLWKLKFSELLRQALPWQPHISGEIISFSFSFCSFYPIGMKFGLAHRTDITGMALWKIEFSELLRQALPWQPHISGKIISFSFSFFSFYPIGMKFGTQDRYNMTLWKIEFSELLHQALPWHPHISGGNNFIFI